MLRLTHPALSELQALAEKVRSDPFTYEAVGATAHSDWPAGYRHDREWVDLGDDSEFAPAAARLKAWQPHVGAGVLHAANGDIEPGTCVALAAPALGLWVLATCRIVYVQEEPDCFAWAYGTLPLHPEEGEERFELTRSEGRTRFSVAAFSRPRHWLARSTSPIARRLQVKATHAYLASMRPSPRDP